MAPLRIGFVPEHFSTPLHFAKKYFSLSADLIPFPAGTGHMVSSLRAGELDIAVGLTEGWVSALATQSQSRSDRDSTQSTNNEFRIVGTYVESPLCWAISTGLSRNDIITVSDLKEDSKLGVSRIGSGSYIMGFVLADREDWAHPSTNPADPFHVVPLQNFENLRKAVNDKTADFFMWEYFTSKRYYAADASPYPIKQIGEIYSPWSSWKIVASTQSIGKPDLDEVLTKVNLGIKHFKDHPDEAVQYISSELDYEKEDAREWLNTVKFADDVKGVKKAVVEKTVEVLGKAGVLKGEEGKDVGKIIGIMRKE
ncbi:MAG: hypothetical protein LQ352_006294 [Teloschistes flavicans]|nr:MAG: hypothetical protein LQ352_006294 [Teloschistes flavicans]